MRRPAAHNSYPSAKKGKRRPQERLASTRKTSNHPRKPPWKNNQKKDGPAHARLDRQTWDTSLTALATMTELSLVKYLRALKILPTWACCPRCKVGYLSPLRCIAGRGLVQKCTRKNCRKFVAPHFKHPVFELGHGQSSVPLRLQAQVLFCLAVNITLVKIQPLVGVDHKHVERLTRSWLALVASRVERKQDGLQLGDGEQWMECEVDEACMRGRRCGNKVTWLQYCGIVRRGERRSLILHRMRTKTTSVRMKGKGDGGLNVARADLQE